MEKILCKRPLVFLQLEVVLVLRKILGHGNQLLADLVPPFRGLFRPRTHLRLALRAQRNLGKKKQDQHNENRPKAF